MKTVIQTSDAPAAIGPYSQAIKVGRTIYCSGQIGLDPKTGNLIEGGFEAQTHQMFRNVQAVVRGSGATMAQVVKMTLFLTDLSHFSKVNEIAPLYFDAPFPARSTVGVASLPKGAQIECEVIVVLND
jgi:2-iminobutanoate/2-iminopropanoate deaminase